jgi:hypothetical protein
MGTRHLTVFKESTVDSPDIVVMYGQWDGHLESHGMALKEHFGNHVIVCGISGDETNIANGMSCLAAQVVAKFKDKVGSFYLHPAGTRDRGEEFVYTLYVAKEHDNSFDYREPLRMRVQTGHMTFFGMPGTPQDQMPIVYDGLLSEFDPSRCKKEEDEDPDQVV